MLVLTIHHDTLIRIKVGDQFIRLRATVKSFGRDVKATFEMPDEFDVDRISIDPKASCTSLEELEIATGTQLGGRGKGAAQDTEGQ